METWLNQHAKSGALQLDDSIILDIGAYHGDFTTNLLQTHNIHKAFLFEANPENFAVLENKFPQHAQIDLVPYAIGSAEGEIEFYCDADKATGSLLPYQYRPNDAESVKRHKAKLTSIDQYLLQHPLQRSISLIKTDTQGNDLHVLQGAEKTIAHYQPWLVVELIFLPLYENQGNPDEIYAWFATRGYGLAAMFNMHYSSDGWLAFADGIFVPSDKMIHFTQNYSMIHSNAQLLAENAMLKQACEERLQLINRLSNPSPTATPSTSSRYSRILKKILSYI